MSADFWAGYASGALGIVVGNPLDLIKVRLQAQTSNIASAPLQVRRALTTGTAAPVLGYGALNALLFVSYNRCEEFLRNNLAAKNKLFTTWCAGACGGLATWVISAPTELIKCRAQASVAPLASSCVARRIYQERGLRGFYLGGAVTALRDSIGYGFYFWSYELTTSLWPVSEQAGSSSIRLEGPKTLLCGGFAGIATWATVFPLDVIKTRIQTRAANVMQHLTTHSTDHSSLSQTRQCNSAVDLAREMYRQSGTSVFFRGFSICCIRAFFVNAIQWAVYEAIMSELTPTVI